MVRRADRLPESFADLHRRLGGVPLDRIRLDPPPGTATEADLERVARAGDQRLFELVDGVLVEKAMGSHEGALSGYIHGMLFVYLQIHDSGLVLGGDGAVRIAPGNVRYPDVSYLPWDRVPDDPRAEAIWTAVPLFAVEVLSRNNTAAEIDRKLRELFAGGCKLAWVIDPVAESAEVYTSATKSKTVVRTGALDAGKVLPGFKLSLTDLFDAADKRRKKGKPK